MELKRMTRAFIVIEFPDEAIKEAARIQELLGNQNFHGKITELENLHLTLKFLGEIDEEKLKEVQKILRRIEFDEFELKLGSIGVFHFKKNPRIVWIKILGKEIYELQKKIDLALSGIFPEEKRFMGHLTIARVKYVKDKSGFIEYAKKINIQGIKFKVSEFKLKKSELGIGGPVYTDIECFKSRREI